MASSKLRQFILSAAMLAVALSFTILLYLSRPPTETAEPEYKPVSVDVAEVVKEDIRIEIQAQGTVTPMHQSSLQAEVKGRVIEVSAAFNAGGFVKKDEVLLRIDPRDYETSLLRAEASVETAESTLAQEKGRAQVALREWKKLPAGSQRSQEAKDLYLRKPQLEQAQAQLQAAKADFNTAQDNLDRTTIRAPYDALIKAKHTDLGQFVSPGTRLADVFSIAMAEIRLPIPQGKLDYLELPQFGSAENTGSPIDLYTDVGGDVKHWKAQLHRTEGVFDERSRSLYAVARVVDPYGLENPDAEQLRMGTFVNANIRGRELQGIVPLPRYVLRAGNFVWVVDENKRLRNRPVSLLRTGGDLIYVSAGLDNGDLVSLTTLDSSFESSEVTIHSVTPTNKLDKSGKPRPAEPGDIQEVTAAVDAAEKESDG